VARELGGLRGQPTWAEIVARLNLDGKEDRPWPN